MNKNRFVWVIIGILAVMGLCTAISARNYVDDKPTVMLTDTVPNSIHKQLSVTAGMYYKEKEILEVPADCLIEEVYVQVGDKVEAGSGLLRLNEADLQIQYLQMQIRKEGLEEAKEAGGLSGELAFWQLQSLEEDIATLEQLIAADCTIKATESCVVISQGYTYGDMTTGSSRLEMAYPKSGCYLEWTLPRESYLNYIGTAVVEGEKLTLSWEQPSYNTGVYTYTSDLPNVTECLHGEPVEVELMYTSQEYRSVLPKSCIYYDTDGSAYIFQLYSRTRMLGTEYYVRKIFVDILEMDDTNVAISSPSERIIKRTSMKLSDMMTVMLVEE